MIPRDSGSLESKHDSSENGVTVTGKSYLQWFCVLPILWISSAAQGCSQGVIGNSGRDVDREAYDADGKTGGDSFTGADGDPQGCPILDFTATPSLGSASLKVQLTAELLAANTVYKWSWDLGDGTVSGSDNPQRRYYTPGTYNVTVTVTDRNGSCTLTKDNLIEQQRRVAVQLDLQQPRWFQNYRDRWSPDSQQHLLCERRR